MKIKIWYLQKRGPQYQYRSRLKSVGYSTKFNYNDLHGQMRYKIVVGSTCI